MQKKYKVLFILDIPSFYKINLLNKINEVEKIKVLFLAADSDQRNKDFFSIEKIKFDYEILSSKKIEKLTFKERLKLIYFLLKKLNSINYDNLILNEWVLFESWFSLLLSLDKKKIFILESSIYESKITGIKAIIKKIFLSLIDVALPSGIAHQRLLEALGFSKKSYFTNGVGILNKTNLIKQNYPKKPKNFLYVGRLIKLKNIDFLIKVFNNYPNLTLNIVGSGEDEKYLKSIAKNNIKFLGYIPNKEIGKVFIENDVFILPSFSETWGLVIEEAIYYGLPIICSNKVGSSDYYVKEKQTGEVFEINNENSFITSLENITNNYEKYVNNIMRIDFEKEIKKQIEAYIKAIDD